MLRICQMIANLHDIIYRRKEGKRGRNGRKLMNECFYTYTYPLGDESPGVGILYHMDPLKIHHTCYVKANVPVDIYHFEDRFRDFIIRLHS